MKNHRSILFISVILIFMILLTACQPKPEDVPAQMESTKDVAQPAATADDSQAKTIVIAMAAAPITLDPADHRNRESETVIRNIFDGLVTRDTRSGVHMQLAESMDWTDDTTLEILLRKDVKFHDGSPMTADDVVFTFERIIKENQIDYPEVHSSPRKGLIAPLESIEKLETTPL